MSNITKTPKRIWEEIINNDDDVQETRTKKAMMFQPKKKFCSTKQSPYKPRCPPKLVISLPYKNQTLVAPKDCKNEVPTEENWVAVFYVLPKLPCK